ncbi:hypothetical protein [uncultured Psychroserpens sp.]|uniref:hypothetical protein n=1 Tax=uncultured Psychroserpens sp. TaxID=255436 RepID=UPI0026226AF8|nr:hypothetical protein [uncultured Psychroserpens sp.]
MKHFAFTLLFSLFFNFGLVAQNDVDFGIKGGLNLTFFKVVESNFGPNTETEAGYYGGVFAVFDIEDVLAIQPEVLYIGLNDFKFINAPIYVKYEVANNFNVMVGPSLNYFFDFFNNKFKVRADVCAAYNITDAIDIHTKYTIGFEEIAPNGLFFGVGIRL